MKAFQVFTLKGEEGGAVRDSKLKTTQYNVEMDVKMREKGLF